jgi:lysophospholipase L1-like esterase
MLPIFLAACSHDQLLPINPRLGVPGFPSCDRKHPLLNLSVAQAADDLVCHQRKASNKSVTIATIGDSITAGVCSSGGNHPYPSQLQMLLDASHGAGSYSVTNLGECGSTMLKKADSPYWQRSSYITLTTNKWDIVTIMLGTNDAKDPGSHGPNNWPHDCGTPTAPKIWDCQFAADYNDMIEVVSTLGTESGKPPKIYLMVPPPLMEDNAYGMNRTVINSLYPVLVPRIAAANSAVTGIIDMFIPMGGEHNGRPIRTGPPRAPRTRNIPRAASIATRSHATSAIPTTRGTRTWAMCSSVGSGSGESTVCRRSRRRAVACPATSCPSTRRWVGVAGPLPGRSGALTRSACCRPSEERVPGPSAAAAAARWPGVTRRAETRRGAAPGHSLRGAASSVLHGFCKITISLIPPPHATEYTRCAAVWVPYSPGPQPWRRVAASYASADAASAFASSSSFWASASVNSW